MFRRISVIEGVLFAALMLVAGACDDAVTPSKSRPTAEGAGPARVTVVDAPVAGVDNSPLEDANPTVSYPWMAWDQQFATPTESDPNLLTRRVAVHNLVSGETRHYEAAGGAGADAHLAAISGGTLAFVSWEPATQRWLLEAVDLVANTRRTVLSLGTAVDALDFDGNRVVWSGVSAQGVTGIHLVDLTTDVGETLYAAAAGEQVHNPRISGANVLFQVGRNLYLYSATTKTGSMMFSGVDAADIDGSRIAYAELLSSGTAYFRMFDVSNGDSREFMQMWANAPVVRAAADRIAFSGTMDPYGDHVFIYDVGTQEIFQVDPTLSNQVVTGLDSRLVAWADDRNKGAGNPSDVMYSTIQGSPVNNDPTLQLASSFSGVEGANVAFNAQASDPDGDVLSYQWLIGGVGFGTPQVSRQFIRSGSYPVSVTVSDGRGGSATATSQVDIANAPPAVNALTVTPSVEAGQPVSLAADFFDPGTGDSPWSWVVQWGDGSSSNGQAQSVGSVAAAHSYSAAGSYTVTFSIADPDGASTSSTATVAVTAPPPPPPPPPTGNTPAGTNVQVSPDDGRGGHPVTITFGNVGVTGNTTISAANASGVTGVIPSSVGAAWSVTTTAQFSGAVTVCVTYSASGSLKSHPASLLQQNASGQWVDITTSRTVSPTAACGQTSVLSTFVVAARNGGWDGSTDGSVNLTAAVLGGGSLEAPKAKGQHARSRVFFDLRARTDRGGHVRRDSHFQLRADGLRFEDVDVESVDVSGASAVVKGTGRLERSRTTYRFVASVVDGRGRRGRADRARIKIWNPRTGELLYDSQPGAGDDAAPTTELGAGRIEVRRR